jgi:hypothetical protein
MDPKFGTLVDSLAPGLDRLLAMPPLRYGGLLRSQCGCDKRTLPMNTDMQLENCPVCKGQGTIRDPKTLRAEKCPNPKCEHGNVRVPASRGS